MLHAASENIENRPRVEGFPQDCGAGDRHAVMLTTGANPCSKASTRCDGTSCAMPMAEQPMFRGCCAPLRRTMPTYVIAHGIASTVICFIKGPSTRRPPTQF